MACESPDSKMFSAFSWKPLLMRCPAGLLTNSTSIAGPDAIRLEGSRPLGRQENNDNNEGACSALAVVEQSRAVLAKRADHVSRRNHSDGCRRLGNTRSSPPA